MAEWLKNRDELPRTDRLLTVDNERAAALSEEITRAHENGVNVTVGERSDLAYQSPEKIIEIFEKLRAADEAVERARALNLGIGAQKLNYITSGQSPRQSWEEFVNNSWPVENARREHLYGREHTDAEAWWRQGGSALALATIVQAYDLAERGNNDGYPTMSGSIDRAITTHYFDDSLPELSGLSLESAVAATAQNYGLVRGLRPLNQEERAEKASKKMAQLDSFVQATSTSEFLDVIRYCQDGIGIRERMTTVNDRIMEHLSQDYQSNSPVIVSLGCGTAIPILDLMRRLHEQDKSPRLIAIDQDPIALAVAQKEAQRLGLSDAVELHYEPLFSKTGRPADFSRHLQGRIPEVIENSGLREYVPDIAYHRLMKSVYNKLGSGGLAVNCSTNENRPHEGFLYGAMGWPVRIRCCGIEDMAKTLEKGGFVPAFTDAEVVASGVYTCYFSQKL